ncbi:SLC13 family permease [Sulfurimonas diazotrophicus]|uniref:SLC13 family permease n=1 Tax=Sulfurimonas diazotrophicus TaxID=3131939 RepID=A0ABZ3HDZ6_9BACT
MGGSTVKILWAVGTALLLYALVLPILSPVQAALAGVVTLLVVLWTNEGLPLGVVSLLPIVLFPALHILPTKMTTVNYAHPIIYLFLGGFMLAIAVEKSGLHIWIARKMLGIFPATGRGIIISLAVTSGVMSSILSNTTTALLLMTIALFLSDDPRLKMRFTLAIAYGASIGGILTPIGTPPNLILLGVMEEHGMAMIPFVQWMWMVAPLALVMIVVISVVLAVGIKDVRLALPEEEKPLSGDQKKLLALLGGLVVLLLVNAPIRPWWEGLGMSEPVILLSAGLLLFAPPFNLLIWQEDKAKIPYRIMFLFGAGFAIAKAFSETGLAGRVAEFLVDYSYLTPLYLMLIVAALITFTTEITSNTALISIMLPVIYAVAQQTGLDATLFMMVATICSSYAFMLPIATPPNAIAMSSGVIPIRTMALYGLLFNLVGIILIVLIAYLFWRPVLG